MRCAIWYHLHNLKNVNSTHGRVLILVKLQAEANIYISVLWMILFTNHILHIGLKLDRQWMVYYVIGNVIEKERNDVILHCPPTFVGQQQHDHNLYIITAVVASSPISLLIHALSTGCINTMSRTVYWISRFVFSLFVSVFYYVFFEFFHRSSIRSFWSFFIEKYSENYRHLLRIVWYHQSSGLFHHLKNWPITLIPKLTNHQFRNE